MRSNRSQVNMNTSMSMRATIFNNIKVKKEKVYAEVSTTIKLFKVPNHLEQTKIIKVMFLTILEIIISTHLYS